jgi:hypothetical protein
MPKKSSVRRFVKAISILERAERDWPEGASDPLIGEALQKAKEGLLYQMYRAERENVGGGGNGL